MARVLIVDDEPGMRISVSRFLVHEGHEVETAGDVDEALLAMENQDFDVVISDVIMPRRSGVELLHEIAAQHPRTKVVLITGEPTFETASEAVRLGAFDYLAKPISKESVCKLVKTAAHVKRLEDQNLRYNAYLESEITRRTQQVTDYNARLKLVAEGTRQFDQCASANELASAVLALLAKAVGAGGGSFFLRDRDDWRLAAALDAGHQSDQMALSPPPKSAFALALKRRMAFAVEETSLLDDVTGSGWPGYRDGSFLALPLLEPQGEVLGVVFLHNKDNPPFFDQDLKLGRIIAAHSADAFKNLALADSLRASETKYRALSESSQVGILVAVGGRIVYANARMAELLGGVGQPTSAVLGRAVTDFVQNEQRELLECRFAECECGAQGTGPIELDFVRPDSSIARGAIVVSSVEYAGGQAVMANVLDISQQRHAEQERDRLEQQLIQSQKMEAVGRLAGGIAHDFNNLLTAITGSASIALMHLDRRDPLATNMRDILETSTRAAELTRQLLVFSRRQLFELKVLDLHDLLERMRKMLTRLIGEDIDLTAVADEALWHIKADSNQIEQIVINLAVNARDSMPGGGKLVIEVANVVLDQNYCDAHVDAQRGRFVQLAVSDTGCGMDRAILQRIFEPFFTTKPADKGTGLGLATVYGIVKQHQGSIEVYSEVGLGTTFKIYLPMVDGSVDPIPSVEMGDELPGGQETILLVEDEKIVRVTNEKILARLGYQVLVASHGEEALGVADAYDGPIQLLLTDVVMPRMNGRELAERIGERRPECLVLFTSGYTNQAMGSHRILEHGVQFIAKPYTPMTLALKIREVLDSKQPTD